MSPCPDLCPQWTTLDYNGPYIWTALLALNSCLLPTTPLGLRVSHLLQETSWLFPTNRQPDWAKLCSTEVLLGEESSGLEGPDAPPKTLLLLPEGLRTKATGQDPASLQSALGMLGTPAASQLDLHASVFPPVHRGSSGNPSLKRKP